MQKFGQLRAARFAKKAKPVATLVLADPIRAARALAVLVMGRDGGHSQ